MRKRLIVTGSTLRPQTGGESLLREEAKSVSDANGAIRPTVREIPAGRGGRRTQLMESSAHLGKIVLTL
jgi:hypothetical protein